VEAERETEVIRYQAETEANRMLAEVAGDPSTALRLGLAIRKLDELETLEDLGSSPAEQASRLEEFIRIVNNDITTLAGEIRQEQLLGRVSPARESLLAEYRQWRDTLEEVRSGIQDEGEPRLSARLTKAQELAEQRFSDVAGTAAATFAHARAYRWQRELGERSQAESFRRELLAYQASPEMYMLDRWLDVWDEVLPDMHKYVLGVDKDRIELWLNLERERGVLEGVYESDGDDN
ncbi:MAG: hypothetical protein ACOC9S_07070, partial [Planctomycetota bacterium]